jgi:hypothetical protein
MKTDQLIDILSTNLQPADRGKTWRAMAGAIIVGAALAFVAMLLALGPRSDLAMPDHRGFVWLKLLFTLSVVALATSSMTLLARPGGDARRSIVLLVPFAVITIAAIGVLCFTSPTAWTGMILGKECLSCLLAIPSFSAIPFAALVWALRRWGAPTDLGRAGAIAGLVAGGLGATAYALHCPDDSVPFIALWYGLTIGLCTIVGAKLGPRLLRW